MAHPQHAPRRPARHRKRHRPLRQEPDSRRAERPQDRRDGRNGSGAHAPVSKTRVSETPRDRAADEDVCRGFAIPKPVPQSTSQNPRAVTSFGTVHAVTPRECDADRLPSPPNTTWSSTRPRCNAGVGPPIWRTELRSKVNEVLVVPKNHFRRGYDRSDARMRPARGEPTARLIIVISRRLLTPRVRGAADAAPEMKLPVSKGGCDSNQAPSPLARGVPIFYRIWANTQIR